MRMINYSTELKNYANDRGIRVSDMDIFRFNISFAVFCKECERCIIITLYPNIDESPHMYQSDDNLRYIYIVICDDCTRYISYGDDWKIDPDFLSQSIIYVFTTKIAKTIFFDKDNTPILKINSALISDSVYQYIMHIKSIMNLHCHIMREIVDDKCPVIVDFDEDGFF